MEAEESFVACTLENPTYAPAFSFAAQAQFQQLKFDEAIVNFESALRLAPTDWKSWLSLGHLRFRANQFESASKAYTKAVRLSDVKEEGSDSPSTIERRVAYDSLGQSFIRLGLVGKAKKVWKRAVRFNLWDRPDQRPTQQYLRFLKGKPWWDNKESFPIVKKLEKNFDIIRQELQGLLGKRDGKKMFGGFGNISKGQEMIIENGGEWTEFKLAAKGKLDEMGCKKCPKTCAIINDSIEVMGVLKSPNQNETVALNGEVLFLSLAPNTKLRPHTGPSNVRLTVQLALQVPNGKCTIRVGDESRQWVKGKALIFDDSFEHEVVNDSDSYRYVLYVSIFHPQLWPHLINVT
eukprot:g2367.t1